jgi:hypothetical protein
MTFDSIIAFGDSTTAGCELIPKCIDWDKTKKLSFPNILADTLKIPCYNYAWPGGSNDRSLRLLPEALLSHPNSLVLFTYTSFDRTEFFTTNEHFPQDHTGYYGVGINWDLINTIKQHKDLNQFYLKNLYEDTAKYNRYKIFNTMLLAQLLCEKYSKRYFQIFLYDSLLLSPNFQNSVFEELDKEKIYKFDYGNDSISWKDNNEGFGSLRHWAKMKGYSFCPGGHIGQDAHTNFAMELYNLL